MSSSKNLKLLAVASVAVYATAKLLKKFVFVDSKIRAKSIGEKGDAALQANKWSEAINLYTQVIEFNIGDSYNVWYYKRRAEAYFGMGRFDKALEDCNAAIRLDSKYATAFTLRGVIMEKLGNQDEAYEDYRQALRLSGNRLAEYRLQILDRQQRRISSRPEGQNRQRNCATAHNGSRRRNYYYENCSLSIHINR